MSYELRRSSNDDNIDDTSSVVAYNRNAHFGPTVQYTSSVSINIRQLQTDLHARHQHEKEALNELNQRFYLFVNRVQQVESQNSKLLAEIANYRRTATSSSADIQLYEHYLSLNSDVTSLRYARLDSESDFEWFQAQVGIYQQLIDIEQRSKDTRHSKLEQELKQLASDLHGLRTSYGELERVVVSHYAERDNLLTQYLSLTHDSYSLKKQKRKWDLSLDSLKVYIGFYKRIRSYSVRSFESSSSSSVDLTQYWTLELDKSVKKIRRDFELFYGTINREIAVYYETKMEDVKKDVEQALYYQQMEYEEFSMTQQTLQVEYEAVSKSYSYEKEILVKYEATYSKLQAEFQSLELQYGERFEAQSKELHSAQESIMLMAYDIDEIRRSKINLEAEIIVYRHLLDNTGVEGRVTVVAPSQPVKDEMTGQLVAKRQRKGSIGIKECAPSGTYISLMNHSNSKDIDISRWVLKRRVESGAKLRYTIPDGVRLQRGRELRIYSKQGNGVRSPNQSGSSSSAYQELVNNDVVSWGAGNVTETHLLNPKGEEESSYLQSFVYGGDYI